MATTDRATIYENMQLGYESTPGTAVAANRRLSSLSIEPAINIEVEMFKPRGRKFTTLAAPNREWSSARVQGKGTYTEIIYPACSAMTNVTPSTPAGATLTRRWTFLPLVDDADDPASYSVEIGSSRRASSFAYALFTDFGLTFNRKTGVALDGTLMGQRTREDKIRWITVVGSGGTFTLTVGGQTTTALDFDSTGSEVLAALEALSTIAPGDVSVLGGPLPTAPIRVYFLPTGAYGTAATPSFTANGASLTGTGHAVTIGRMNGAATPIGLVPILGSDISVYAADTFAGLDAASRVSRFFNVAWKLNNRYGPIWELNDSIESYADIVETDPTSDISVRVGANDANMAYLESLRAGDTVFWRIEATSKRLIETGFPFRVQLDMAVKLKSISPMSDEDGLVALDFGGDLAEDGTWGYATQLIVDNDLTTL